MDKNKNKKERGLTLLETMVGVTIVLVVSSFLFFKIIKNNEKMELEKNRRVIQVFFNRYITKSFYENTRYTIEINMTDKYLKVTRAGNELLEKVHLSDKLCYGIVYGDIKYRIFKIDTTETGNLGKSFTLYIFGYKNQVENRIAFYIFQKEKILKINTYLNEKVKNVNYSNIIEYHYSKDGENRVGWKSED